MDVKKTNLYALTDGNRQYVMFNFQRIYCWEEENLLMFLDAIRFAHGIRNVLLGNMIVKAWDIVGRGCTTCYSVIDGQQRLTTLSLFLKALAVYSEHELDGGGTEAGRTLAKTICSQYLFNSNATGAFQQKILPTYGDRASYRAIIYDEPQPKDFSPNIYYAYNFFLKHHRDNKPDADDIRKALTNILCAEIVLEDGDDAHRTFRSVNSSGVPLAQYNLVMSLLLQHVGATTVEEADRYSLDYQHPLEDAMKIRKIPKRFDEYLCDWISMTTEKNVRRDEVNIKFEHYVAEKGYATLEILKELHNAARHWVPMVDPNVKHENPLFAPALEELCATDIRVAGPLVLRLLIDHDKKIIDDETARELLELTCSYLVRRRLAGLPPNSHPRAIIQVIKNIDKDDYRNSVVAAFLKLRDTDTIRFPSDNELVQAMRTANFTRSGGRKHLLTKIEGAGPDNEKADTKKATVEHIMPQRRPDEHWRAELGPDWEDVHRKYVDTIGNMTISSDNSSLGARPFKEKKELPKGGYRASIYRLSKMLIDVERWDEAAIIRRSDAIAQDVLRIWPMPELDGEARLRYNVQDDDKRAEKQTRAEVAFFKACREKRDLIEDLCRQVMNLDGNMSAGFSKYGLNLSVEEQVFANIRADKGETQVQLCSLSPEEVNELQLDSCAPTAAAFSAAFVVKGEGDLEDAVRAINRARELLVQNR